MAMAVVIITMGIPMPDCGALSTLRLWQLISPTLPVGAYAYSAGLETAVEAGWLSDEAALLEWVSGQLEHGLAGLDLPILLRLREAWIGNHRSAVGIWTDRLLASRETAELRAEDIHLGRALMRLLGELGIDEAREFDRRDDVTLATGFALAAARWDIDAPEAGRGYAWGWCENQVAAAVKLIPLGQTAGQRVLMQATDSVILAVVSARHLADEDIGATTPGVSLASGWHETQYTRLFRS